MNAATNLTIQIGQQDIGISLPGGNISIVVNNDQPLAAIHAPAAAPKLEWSQTLLDGESVTYEKAEKAVAALGEGWRLPTRYEAESILDLTRHDPAVDPEKYPGIKSAYHWTSTPCAWNDSAVWVVDFGDGYVGSSYRRDGLACVLAVRSSQ